MSKYIFAHSESLCSTKDYNDMFAIDTGFKLKIPAPYQFNTNPPLEPENLALWIKELPLADIAETAKLLLKKVMLLNRTNLSPHQRNQLIGLLTIHIERVLFVLENNYVDSDPTFPISQKNKDTTLICIKLTKEMSYCYKLIIQHITFGKLNYPELTLPNRELLQPALFYAVHWLSHLLYVTGLVYQNFPEHLWLDLHTIFAFACTNSLNLTHFKIRLGLRAEQRDYSIQDIYIQSLMFAIADPVRMRPQEMRTLYKSLPFFSKIIVLNNATADSNVDSTFTIRLHSDKPPTHSSIVKQRAKSSFLQLDTTAIVKVMQDFYDDTNTKSQEVITGATISSLPKTTIKHLIHAWGNKPKRHFARTKMNMEVCMFFGIDAIHAHLEGEDMSLESAHLVSDAPKLGRKTNNYENFGLVARDTDYNVYHKDQTEAPKVWEDSNHVGSIDMQPSIILHTLNESIGGFCVDWNRNNVPKIKIGQLVGITDPKQQSNCAIAVIRWIQDDRKHGSKVGIQVLAHEVKPITVKRQSTPGYLATKCLMIPPARGIDGYLGYSLIAPPLIFNATGKEDLFIKEISTERRARLLEPVEVNKIFANFRFEFKQR